jgi:hypothetical protein
MDCRAVCEPPYSRMKNRWADHMRLKLLLPNVKPSNYFDNVRLGLDFGFVPLTTATGG